MTGYRIETHNHSERTCRRCGGSGIIRQYVRVNGGECFRCGGRGLEDVFTPKTRAELLEERRLRDLHVAAVEAGARNGGNPFLAALEVSRASAE